MALFAAPCARFSIIMLWFWALPAVSGTAAASSPQSRPLRLLLGVLRGGCASAGAALDPPRDETARAAVRQLDDELREAVRSLNASRAEALIARGARVNAVERGTHATPLITAAFQNDREMIDVLLAAGANPNLGDDMHMVPLHYAAAWGYDEIVDKLMCAGTNPLLHDLHDKTALQLALDRGHNRTADLLQRWLDAR